MDESLVEIRCYTGEGFMPLVSFGGWRVAALNYLDGVHPDNNKTMERHMETDEVFVLTRGQGIILIGGNGPELDGVYPQEMETGTVYNIRRGTWHTILLSRDASVLIMEQADTGKHNSEYASLSSALHQQLVEIAEREPKFM
jgi:mannose-6-phosphate isomerase-like protein (cupin superfamily)